VSLSSSERSTKDMPGDDSPLHFLRAASEQVNPAITLADRLMRRDAEKLLTVEEVSEAEKVLAIGTQEIETVEFHRKAFLKTPASAIDYVPIGF
jgi:hypothetical protein